MFNVMIVEDEINIQKLMSIRLVKSGFNVLTANNGVEALDIITKYPVDIMLVDIMMPKMNGFELVKEIRDTGNNIPVIMITSKDSIDDKTNGFSVGIDDYMTKPIDYSELILRINAIMRRSKIANEKKIVIGKVTLEYDSLTIKREDETLILPKKEFLILFKLLSYPEKVFTKIELLDEFWGYYSESDDATIKVHINRLRSKIEKYKEFEIVTIRGLGYKGIRHE